MRRTYKRGGVDAVCEIFERRIEHGKKMRYQEGIDDGGTGDRWDRQLVRIGSSK